MNPEQYPEQPVTLSKANPLEVQQPGEQTVCEIKRHPIGIIGNYVTTIFGLLALAVLGYFLIHQFVNADSRTHIMLLFSLGWAGLTLISLLILLMISKIYWNNRWIVTTDSLTQVQQIGLLQHQTSQLSMANLEDVTAVQNGLLQSMFNYGTLRVETAGERSKFIFPYCPNPNEYARQILACREAYIRNDPTMAKRGNDMLATPAYAATPPVASLPAPIAPPTPPIADIPPPASPNPYPPVDPQPPAGPVPPVQPHF